MREHNVGDVFGRKPKRIKAFGNGACRRHEIRPRSDIEQNRVGSVPVKRQIAFRRQPFRRQREVLRGSGPVPPFGIGAKMKSPGSVRLPSLTVVSVADPSVISAVAIRGRQVAKGDRSGGAQQGAT